MANAADTTIPSTLRRKVMARAWEIFRVTYNYPRIPFRSIGRRCFASCLRRAWAEARETVRLAASGVDRLKAAISELSTETHATGLSTRFASSYTASLARSTQSAAYARALEFVVAA